MHSLKRGTRIRGAGKDNWQRCSRRMLYSLLTSRGIGCIKRTKVWSGIDGLTTLLHKEGRSRRRRKKGETFRRKTDSRKGDRYAGGAVRISDGCEGNSKARRKKHKVQCLKEMVGTGTVQTGGCVIKGTR